jgi:hypothetical protein
MQNDASPESGTQAVGPMFVNVTSEMGLALQPQFSDPRVVAEFHDRGSARNTGVARQQHI